MFHFGSKLLVSGLIDTIYRNVYYLVIGKYFTAAELGYYTRADGFQSIPSSNLSNIIGRVGYPVLALLKDDADKLKAGYKKLIKSSMLISFVLMLGMAAVARPMVLTLIGEKWLPCVPYLQLLCLVGMFYPVHALNLDMLKVKGRSDLFLKLEVIKKILAIPTIVIGVFFGIKIMIVGMLANSSFCLLFKQLLVLQNDQLSHARTSSGYSAFIYFGSRHGRMVFTIGHCYPSKTSHTIFCSGFNRGVNYGSYGPVV